MLRFIFFLILSISVRAFAGAEFIHFATWEDAKKYYETVAPIYAAAGGEEIPKVVARDQAPYEKLEGMIKDITAGFARYFPAVAAQQTPPKLLIIDDPEFNAFAMRDLTSERNPYLFVIHQEALTISESAMQSTIAHELTHLFLQYTFNGEPVPPHKYYLDEPGTPEFGVTIKNNSEVQATIEKLFDLYDEAGPFANPELGNVPLSYDPLHTNARLLQYLLKKNPIACAAASNSYGNIINITFSNLSMSDFRVHIASELVKLQLRALTISFETQARTCLAGIKVDVDEFMKDSFSLPQDILQGWKLQMSAKEKADYEEAARELSAQPAIEVIFDGTKEARQTMQQMHSQIDFSRIRIYTEEDEADEIAVYVLFQMGIQYNALEDLLMGPDQQQSCDLSREPTSYGALEEPHHSGCFRAYRNIKYAEYLAQLPKAQRDSLYATKQFVRPMITVFRLK